VQLLKEREDNIGGSCDKAAGSNLLFGYRVVSDQWESPPEL
jgi:hypothetical protein